MIARVIEPPAPIVTWQEAKAHLRVGDHEKDYVERLISAAQAWFDGPSGWLGHSFGLQVIEMVGDFTDEPLPYQPIAEVVSIVYRDTAGVEQTMDDGSYRLLYSGAIYADAWPSTDGGPEPVAIRVRAGYAPRLVTPEGGGEPVEVSTVPESVREALLLIVGHWFANRETVVTGTIASEVPLAAMSLLSPFRSWRS